MGAAVWCDRTLYIAEKFTNTRRSTVYKRAYGLQVSSFGLLFLKTWPTRVHKYFQDGAEDALKSIAINLPRWDLECLFNVTWKKFCKNYLPKKFLLFAIMTALQKWWKIIFIFS